MMRLFKKLGRHLALVSVRGSASLYAVLCVAHAVDHGLLPIELGQKWTSLVIVCAYALLAWVHFSDRNRPND